MSQTNVFQEVSCETHTFHWDRKAWQLKTGRLKCSTQPEGSPFLGGLSRVAGKWPNRAGKWFVLRPKESSEAKYVASCSQESRLELAA